MPAARGRRLQTLAAAAASRNGLFSRGRRHRTIAHGCRTASGCTLHTSVGRRHLCQGVEVCEGREARRLKGAWGRRWRHREPKPHASAGATLTDQKRLFADDGLDVVFGCRPAGAVERRDGGRHFPAFKQHAKHFLELDGGSRRDGTCGHACVSVYSL